MSTRTLLTALLATALTMPALAQPAMNLPDTLVEHAASVAAGA